MSDDEGISIYDEVEIEDMTFDEAMGVYQFPCPCGDKFQITLEDLLDEQDIAVCPSCSLMIRVIFDLVCFMRHVSCFSQLTFPRTIYQSLPLQAPQAGRFPSPPESTEIYDRNIIQIAITM
jgi:diphthamide biosynthesis protein 3